MTAVTDYTLFSVTFQFAHIDGETSPNTVNWPIFAVSKEDALNQANRRLETWYQSDPTVSIIGIEKLASVGNMSPNLQSAIVSIALI